jgi:hypothetical protein
MKNANTYKPQSIAADGANSANRTAFRRIFIWQPSALPGWCRVVEIQQQRLLTPIITAARRSDLALLLTAIRGATRPKRV